MLKSILSILFFVITANIFCQAGISKDGKYVFITEDKSKDEIGSTIVIQSTFDSWKKEIKNAYSAQFLSDAKHIQYTLGDSVFILKLGTSNQSGSSKNDGVNARGASIVDLLPSSISEQFTLNTEPIIASADGIKPFAFTGSGNTILFYMQEKEVPKITNNYVDVWSYMDAKNQDAQLRDGEIPRKYAYCYNKKTQKLIRLEEENEKLAAHYSDFVSEYQLNDDYAIVYHFPDDIFTYEKDGVISDGYSFSQSSWNKKTDCDVYLISLKDDSRKLLKAQVSPPTNNVPRYWLSPDGKYVVYAEGGDYYSYEIDDSTTRKIAAVYNGETDKTGLIIPSELYRWLDNDFVLVKDSYFDLLKVDLSGQLKPINITNRFFKKAFNSPDSKILRWNAISIYGNKMICRITCANKYLNDGIYIIELDSVADPKPLIQVNSTYQYDFFQKAGSRDCYLVRRETAEEPPKYFYTSDLKTFRQITGDAPDERPEGIKTEVVTWKTVNGTTSQGVLYKPNNFDSTKKYPIVFVYYESHNQPHNEYRPYGVGDLTDYGYLVFSPDISYTVGETGESACDAVVSAAKYFSAKKYVDSKRMGLRGGSFGGYETNYIVSHSNLFAAAISGAGYSDFISNIGSLDNGTRPHSLEGGNSQNRLGVSMWERPDIWIKNSPLFYADRVSTPLLIVHSMTDDDVPFEQNVAFFRALRYLGKKVWMLQYDNSGHIGGSFSKSIVGKYKATCDMCTRQLQFFNYYLKGAPAPLWMLDGIPAREKGIEKGLELDSTGRVPGQGLRREKLVLTPQQQEILKHKTMVTDDGRVIDVTDKTSNKKN